MNAHAAPRTATLILVCGSIVVTLSLGIRHTFGLFLQPMTQDLAWSREAFSFAIALQNLVWGAGGPVTGWLADRFGAGKVVFGGGLLYAAGVGLMAYSSTPFMFMLSAGVLVGLGLAATTFSVIYGAVGRAVAPEKRAMSLAVVGAAGSFGQFLLVPAGQTLIGEMGWFAALAGLTFAAALMVPLSLGTAEREHAGGAHAVAQSAGEALREAFGERAFWLLTLGYFVCGFQVVFIGAHLPSYVIDKGLTANTGMLALALIGLFNIFGTYGFGLAGGRWSKKKLLAAIYFARSIVIVLFLLAPLSHLSVAVFAATMGLLWLSTVPLTNGLVAQIFGVKYLAMLSGFVFFSHQLGSFLGVWLGGLVFDKTGAYDIVWIVSIALGVLAALVNLPVDERPLARLSPQAAK
ncbi:MAG: MFS transporter [Zoogloeaceae bacterium]|nr:MFS transporter [Zoogloeaceae bacterium]MCK6383228.1 MFS transporter [Rhodocyclaceae bacterium]